MNRSAAPSSPPDYVIGRDTVLNAMSAAVLVLDPADRIIQANAAAENFFATSLEKLLRLSLADVLAFGSPLLALVGEVRRRGISIAEYEIEIGNPKVAPQPVDLQVAPVADQPDDLSPRALLIVIHKRSIAEKIDRQLTHRGAARSLSGMAAVLAHEIRNPLSGIRGAAQVLEQSVDERDHELTRLIREEADRISALVDRMEAFGEIRQDFTAVNVHEVLDHVRKLARHGFARDIRITENYDPSLPPARAAKDQLVQVFLNLVKNAAEAILGDATARRGAIRLTTAYRHGLSMAVAGQSRRVNLPLEICVIDNGPGVADDLRPHLFDPFVTTKTGGKGLGLPLVAKIIGDHGGIVEHESSGGRTIFRVLLPASEDDAS